jgi:putative redox protein
MAQRNSSELTVIWQDDLRFEARSTSGAVGMLDSVPAGEQPAGLSPMEYLLAGLAGCTAMDAISILRKKRQTVTGYRLDVTGLKAEEHPRVYTDITIRHEFQGENLSYEAVRHAIELSEEKYCSAMAMLRKAAKIETSFEIVSPDTADPPVD